MMKRIATLGAVLLLTGAIPHSPALAEENELNSVGSPELGSLVSTLFDHHVKLNKPEVRKGPIWRHRSDAEAIGALMFETADIAAVLRPFDRNELAPYDHQFRGDMMKAPEMIPIAVRGTGKVWIAVNQRPGAPIETVVHDFLDFALSEQGQKLIGAQVGLTRLDSAELARSRASLSFFTAPLDPGLPTYSVMQRVSGSVSSVGSDGMKSLMERWMNGFIEKQPSVARGPRWEHLGTLNGYHALLNGLADIAPMGRELWPQELAAYKASTGFENLLEIRVARGGFNTPQRTTAQAVWVNAANPLKEISLTKLAQIMKQDPAIQSWGQLGLAGKWADRPIHVFMPPKIAPNAMSMQQMVLKGAAWHTEAREGTIADTANAIAVDPAAIGFGGFEEGGPGLKPLAISAADGQAAIPGTYETASNGSYPLTRYMYIRLARPVLPQTREFLRYILSRDGQSPVRFSGYFPLTAREVAEELSKLDSL